MCVPVISSACLRAIAFVMRAPCAGSASARKVFRLASKSQCGLLREWQVEATLGWAALMMIAALACRTRSISTWASAASFAKSYSP